jgi:hypothetical protein
MMISQPADLAIAQFLRKFAAVQADLFIVQPGQAGRRR